MFITPNPVGAWHMADSMGIGNTAYKMVAAPMISGVSNS